MTTYTVTLSVDPSWVTKFNQGGYNLVMAKAVGNPSNPTAPPTFNVVASTSTVTKAMSVSWTENYQLSGSSQSFQNGVTISALSGLNQVSFGDTYFLDDWATYHVAADSNAPTNGFGFRNKIAASVVVAMQAPGAAGFTPVYISPFQLPPGFAKLAPLPKVAFWFQADLSTSTMVSVDQSLIFVVDLSSGSTASINYNAQGIWSRLSTAQHRIDYLTVQAAKVPAQILDDE